jgi:predicted nucleotidyltransferase
MVASLPETLEQFFAPRREPGILSAYLFGSHAQGRAHRESDVDVAVLLSRDLYPTSRERFEVRIQLGSELIDAVDHNEVDVVILNDAPPLFARRIVWEGRRVFLGDPEGERIFVRDVQLRAADLAPFLQRMARIKLEALAR